MSWSPWVVDAISSAPHERPTPPEPPPAGLSEWVRADETEVHSLRRRLRAGPRARPLSLAPVLLGAAGLALAALWLVRPAEEVAPAEVFAVRGVQVRGPLVLDGWGTVQVDDSPQATSITLDEGVVRFSLDPEAQHDLEVRAGDVTVVVTGTVFDVAYVQDAVSVEVLRGSVRVEHGEHTVAVRAGERWPAPSEPATLQPVLPARPVLPPGPAQPPQARLEDQITPPDPMFLAYRALVSRLESGDDTIIVDLDAFASAHAEHPLGQSAAVLALLNRPLQPTERIDGIRALLAAGVEVGTMREHLALLLVEQGRHDEALVELRALCQRPAHPRFWAWRGILAHRAGADDEAQAALLVASAQREQLPQELREEVERRLATLR